MCPLLGNQQRSSIFWKSISTSLFLKIFNALSSKSFWRVLSGILQISRHSHLEHWELIQPDISKNYAVFQFIIDLPSNTNL